MKEFEENMFQCIKCHEVYEVDERGFSKQVGECWYHWGSVYRVKGKVHLNYVITPLIVHIR